jgi:hypothetical protein
MKRIIFVAITMLLCGVSPLSAQNPTTIIITDLSTSVHNGIVTITFNMDYSNLHINAGEEVMATPIMSNGNTWERFSPVIFRGQKRELEVARAERLRNDIYRFSEYNAPDAPHITLSRKDMRAVKSGTVNKDKIIPYKIEIQYSKWMRESRIQLETKLIRCMGYYSGSGGYFDNIDKDLGAIDDPLFAYAEPQVRPIDGHTYGNVTTTILFKVDESKIRMDLGGNAEALAGVAADIDAKMSDGMMVSGITMYGYASPEGRKSYNEKLSARRAASVMAEIKNRLSHLGDHDYTTDGLGEDWDSVRRWTAASELRHKDVVVKIIDETPDFDRRDAKIKGIDGGATYRTIFRKAYPGLRRATFDIAYTLRPFDMEAGRKAAVENPKSLTLEELYRVAESYERGSEEYNAIYETIATIYPDNEAANNNLAVAAIKRGDFDLAESYLSKAGKSPETLNNLGILRAAQGELDEATQLLRESARLYEEAGGNASAPHRNLEKL